MPVDLGSFGDPTAPQPVAVRAPRRRPRYLGLAVVVAILVVAEALALTARLRVDHSATADPRTAAIALFAALDRSDVAAANAQLAVAIPGAGDGGGGVGVNSAVVTDVERRGDTALVTVSYDIGGALEGAGVHGGTTTLLERRDSRGLLHAPRWRVVSGLPTLDIVAPSYVPTVLVGSRSVPLRAGHATVTVFPGVVTVTVPLRPPMDEAAATVGAAGVSVTARLEVGADPDVVQAVQNLVSAQLLPRLLATPGRGLTLIVNGVALTADGRALTFSGQILPADGAGFAVSTISGMAAYNAGRTTITALHVRPCPPGSC